MKSRMHNQSQLPGSNEIEALLGVSEQNQVVDPFQYYALKGESILCTRQASQGGVWNLFTHFDQNGNELARFFEGDSLNSAGSQARTPDQKQKAAPASFIDLMRQMHLAASHAEKLIPTEKVAELSEGFRAEPIVIGGCGRSGTTLLLSMLGAHPSVYAIQEELYCFYPFPARLARLREEVALATQMGKKRWCEKTPKNVRAFQRIWNSFDGKVRLVHLVRDGRDVVTSHHPNHEQRYWVSPERWVADVSAGLELPFEVHLIHFEDLLREPEKTLRKLCNFINEDYDLRMLQPELYSGVKSNVAWEESKIKSMDATRIGRWKDAQHAERVQAFLDFPEAAALMKRLGYL